MTATISVVMATYNGAPYLGDQLASLAAQTRLPLELLVGDDGSSDGTLALVREFARTAPFEVRLVPRPQRLGYAANFLDLMEGARGDLVAFCDQDDIWLPQKLERVEATFAGDPGLAVVSHDISVFREGGEELAASYFSRLAAIGLDPGLCIKGCALAYRRDLFGALGRPDPAARWAHDVWVTAVAVALDRRDLVREPLIRHRIHASNASGWMFSRPRRLADLLRRARWPKSAWRTRFEDFAHHYLDGAQLRDLVGRLDGRLGTEERDWLDAMATARAALEAFRGSEAYRRRTGRVVGALGHLMSRRYGCSGRLLGFARDLAGRAGRDA